ncbi:MAG: T9SS type A sorting domain-containing protein [Bacteroidota bacterium]
MNKLSTLLFFALLGLNNISAATFSSIASGTWSAPATWAITGVDSDGIPDFDDNVTVNSGHTINLFATAHAAKTLLNNGTLSGNGKKLNLYGDFTNSGNVSGLVLYIQAPCTFSSSVVFSGVTNWWIYKNLTISAGTTISASNIVTINSATVTNLGSANLKGISMNSTGKWINGAASTLTLSSNFSSVGSLDASGIGNTFTYFGNLSTQIKSSTYYNLILLGASSTTRTAQGNITILNNFTIGSSTGHAFNMNNFNLTVGGNWLNQSSSNVLNQSTVTFNTSSSQTISRITGVNEVFNNMVVAGTGTTALAKDISVTQNLTLTSGLLDVSTSNFNIDIKGNLVNNSGINCRSGLVSFTGSSAQTISGTQGTSFNDLTTANAAGVSVLSNVAVFYKLLVNSGSFGTSGSGIITIPASGPNTYARIGTVSGSLFGTGWVLESYVNGPAQAGWQWLSSPTSNSTLADWDNDPRFYMSGVGGNDGNATSAPPATGPFRSVRTYNSVTGATVAVTSTTTPLTPGKGFQVWMSDNMFGMTSPLVYNSQGTPNFGTVNFPVTSGGASNGYNLVGNPYACPITYSAVVAASGNLYSTFLILLEDETYSYDPNGGIISPNQGFFCCAFAGGNIVFTEACKNVNGNPNLLKSADPENAIIFSVYNNINGIGGRTFISFTDDATDNFENGIDLAFLPSPSEEADNIYTTSMDQFELLRNKLFNNGEEKDVHMTVKSGVYGTHFISVKGLASLNLYNSVWLEDLTTGKKVDLLKNQEYEFDADQIGKDYEFIVHFSNSKKLEASSVANVNMLNEGTSVYNTPSNVVVKFGMSTPTPVNISIYNLAGQKVIETISTNVTDDRIALPLQKENGMYLLLIQSGDEQITRKIIY